MSFLSRRPPHARGGGKGANQRQLHLRSWRELRGSSADSDSWYLPLMCYMSPWLRLHFCSLSGRLSSWWARSLAVQPATGSLMNRAGGGSFGAFITKAPGAGKEPNAIVQHCQMSPRHGAGRKAGEHPWFVCSVAYNDHLDCAIPMPFLGCCPQNPFQCFLCSVLYHRGLSCLFPRLPGQLAQAGFGQWETRARDRRWKKRIQDARPSFCLRWHPSKQLCFISDSSFW